MTEGTIKGKGNEQPAHQAGAPTCRQHSSATDTNSEQYLISDSIVFKIKTPIDHR